MLFFYSVGIILQKLLPICLSSDSCKRVGHLVMMAERYRQSISGIQIFRVKIDPQGLLDHHADLLLGSRSVATDRNLRLSWRILRYRNAFHDSGSESRTLGTSQFENDLSILSVERGLHGKLVRMMFFDKFAHAGKDIRQLFKWILDLAEVEHAHIHIMRPL